MESSVCRGRVNRSAFGVALIDSEPHNEPPPSELSGLIAPALDGEAAACDGIPEGSLVGTEALDDTKGALDVE